MEVGVHVVKAAPSQEVGLPPPPPPVSTPTKGSGVELHALATLCIGGAYIHVKHLVVPLYFLEFPEDPEDSPLRPFFSSCAVELLHVDLIHLFEGP